MRIKAIHAIRFDGKRFKAGSVFEIPDNVAQTLIDKGFAKTTSERLFAVTEDREPTEQLLQDVNGGKTPKAKVPKK